LTEYNVTKEAEFDALPWDDNKILVLFTAPTWCIPCQRLEPHWNKLKDLYDNIIFVTVDMGSFPEDMDSHWASERFNILGVPQLKLAMGYEIEPVDIKSRAVVPLIKELSQYV